MPAELPLRHETVVHALADAARRAPDAPALWCEGESLSYADYARCVMALARDLMQGSGPGTAAGEGQRVALLMGNSLDIAIATLAVQAAGAQVAALNPAYTAYELTPILQDCVPAVLIHDENLPLAVLDAVRASGVPRLIAVGSGGAAQRLTRWRDAAVDIDALPLPRADQLSTLQYTGGTTGRSKGVDLTHAAVSINVSQREALLPSVPDDERVLVATPLFHVYAVAMGLYLALYARGQLIILPRYRPDAVLQAIERHRITLFSGSPTIFAGLMAYEGFAQAELRSLRLTFSGSSALPVETLRRWEAATGCVVVEGYGQSEAGPVLSYNPRHGVRKPGSVGVALPHTELQIVDVETGTRVLGAGELGEIRARGPQVMHGYRALPDETAAALRDGWLHTGDIGFIDDDGYLHIRDRKKDLVIVGGYNVYPREVEEALHTHPAVVEAAVVGAPDAYRGEVLVAFVVCRSDDGLVFPSAQALQQHLAERLVTYKVPKDLRLIEALPKTAVGKTDKTRLREVARMQ